MQDSDTVANELHALAVVCIVRQWSPELRHKLAPALLALPAHHQAAIFEALVGMRSLDALLTSLPVSLHGKLLRSCVCGAAPAASAEASAASADDDRAPAPRRLYLAITASDADEATPSGAYMRSPLSAAARAALFLQIPGLPPLADVDLSGHELGDDGMAAAAVALSSHTGLTRLALERCVLDCAGAQVFTDALPRWPHLRELNIAENGWHAAEAQDACVTLSAAIGGLKQLTRIDARGFGAAVQLQQALTDLRALRRVTGSDTALIKTAPQLQALDLRGAEALQPDDARELMCDMLRACASLTYLDLSGVLQCDEIGLIDFGGLTALQYLNLEGCIDDCSIESDQFDDLELNELPAIAPTERHSACGLARLSRLTFLCLGSPQHDTNNAAFIRCAAAAVASLPQLHTLKMRSAPADSEIDDLLMQCWGRAAALRTLVCEPLCLLTQAARGFLTNLCELHVTRPHDLGEDLDEDEFRWLGNEVSQLMALETLAVTCYEHARVARCAWALEGLSALKRLRALSFSRVQFDIGADSAALRYAVAAVSTLTCLSLDRCRLTTSDMCQVIESCSSMLKCLEVKRCDAGNANGDRLLDRIHVSLAVQSSTVDLQRLDLSGSYKVGTKVVDSYLSLAQSRASLTSLVLPASADGVDEKSRKFNMCWEGAKVCEISV